jgi:hypothetical protein
MMASEEQFKVFTIVRLAYDATFERACQLAGIEPGDVSITQRIGEKPFENLPPEFRIVSFDGEQITISERIGGERRTRGFSVTPPK